MFSINKKYIANYMKENNIKSFSELAKKIGISTSALTRLWANERNAGSKTIQKMTSFFEEQFEVLFDEKKEA